jgi:hypothetical protein
MGLAAFPIIQGQRRRGEIASGESLALRFRHREHK